jgi:hypothetical protein
MLSSLTSSFSRFNLNTSTAALTLRQRPRHLDSILSISTAEALGGRGLKGDRGRKTVQMQPVS